MKHKQLQGIVTISIILSTLLNCKKYEHLNTTVTLIVHRIIIIRIQHILNYPVLMVGRRCTDN